MEEDLKILIMEYLSNHLLDYAQILNFNWDDQTKFLQILRMKTTSNGRRPQNIDNELTSSYVEIKGKLRWYLECGSAQPS